MQNVNLVWCAPCLDDSSKVSASHVINGVPVCKGCAVAFEDDPEGLKAYRKELPSPEPQEIEPVSDEHEKPVALEERKVETRPSPAKPAHSVVTQKRQRKVVETEVIEVTTSGPERLSRLRIALPSGGELMLQWEGRLFEVSREDRNFIFDIADRMKEYAQRKSLNLPPRSFSILPGLEDGPNFIRDMFDCLDQKQQLIVIEWLKEAADLVERTKETKVTA